MKDERIRQGATFEVTLTDTDTAAETATITVSNDEGIVVTDTSIFALVEDLPTVTLTFNADMAVGEYEYMYTIEYSDGGIVKLPDVANCTGDVCDLPKFTVCEANDIEGSS